MAQRHRQRRDRRRSAVGGPEAERGGMELVGSPLKYEVEPRGWFAMLS